MSKFRRSFLGGSFKSTKQDKEAEIVTEQAWSPTSEASSPLSPEPISPVITMMSSPTSTHSTGLKSPKQEQGPPEYSEQPASGNTRLEALAQKFQIPLYPGLPKIASRDKAPSYLKADSVASAGKLLDSRRTSDPDYKAPSGFSKLTKSKSKIAEFSYKEVNRALNAVVGENGPLDLVEALLEMGGDVDVARRASSNMWKKVTSKNQEEQKSEVLQNAVRGGSTELVQLLAARAGPYTLAESLELATKQDDVSKVRALLEFDASITPSHVAFLDAVRGGNEEIAQMLLAARNPPCQDCLADALKLAVTRGSAPIVGALAITGADANHNDAEAIKEAATRGRSDLALLAASSPKPATALNLDVAADIGYTHSAERDYQLRVVEICLCAGARGPQTEVLLQLAAEQDGLDLANLLLEYYVSIDRDGGKALCIAIQNEHQGIFNAFIGQSMNATTLGNGLISTVEARKLGLDFSRALLGKGATPSFENGQPMVAAVQAFRNDLLALLLENKPSRPALSAPLFAAIALTGEARLDALKVLLVISHDQNALDTSLVKLAEEQHADHAAMTALLNAGASPDANDGRAVAIIACKFDHPTLDLLKPHIVSTTWVYSQAAISVISHPSWAEPDGLSTLQYLLESGADSSAIEEAVIEAAGKFNLESLQFLADWINSAELYTLAFAEIVSLGKRWLDAEHFEVVNLILDQGACGYVVDNALLIAIDSFLSGQTQEILVDCLLEHNADVNHEEGSAFEMAVRAGSVQMLEKLYRFDASEWSMSLALTTALTCQLPAAKVVEVIHSLASREEPKADPNFVVAGLDPLLYLVGCDVEAKIDFEVFGEVQSTPEQWQSGAWQSVVQGPPRTLQIEYDTDTGATLDAYTGALVLCTCQECQEARGPSEAAAIELQRQQAILAEGAKEQLRHEEDGIGAEKVTPLLWACCQVEEMAVTAPVIDVLLQHKADVGYMTSRSRSTALLLAARYHKADVVKSLLKQKPEISVKDKFNRTPLFYASGNGDAKTVRALIQAKARNNDGSLHEATREVHPEVIQMLIKSGHDPNFSSTKHGGLTALGELCMYGDGNGLGGKIDDCIDLLVKARLDPMKKWHGKTLLHMALENPVPFPITSALLERVMYKHVNDPANTYHYQGLNYSPTMVLAKGHFIGTPGDCQALVSLLKSNGAVDVYYADEDLPQPPDAVGLPKVILDAERRRRRHEEDLRYKLEKDMAEMRAAQLKHEQYMAHQDERFKQQYYHRNELNMQDIQHKQQTAEIKRVSEQNTLAFKQRSLQSDAANNYQKVATKQKMNALNRQGQRDQQTSKANMNRLAIQKGNIDARARGIRNAQDAAHDYRKRAHANWIATQKRLR